LGAALIFYNKRFYLANVGNGVKLIIYFTSTHSAWRLHQFPHFVSSNNVFAIFPFWNF